MNTYLKKLLLAAIAIAATLTIQVFASSVSAAGPSLGFPAGKPYYGSSNQRASQSRSDHGRCTQHGTGNRADRIGSERGGPGTDGASGATRMNRRNKPCRVACGCGTATVESAPATAQRPRKLVAATPTSLR